MLKKRCWSSTLLDTILKTHLSLSLGLKEPPPQRTVTVGRNASAKLWLLVRRLPAWIFCTGYLPLPTWWPHPTAGKNSALAFAFFVYMAKKQFSCVYVICPPFSTRCFCYSAGESIYCCFSCKLLLGRVLSTVNTDHRASEKTGTAKRPIPKVKIFNPPYTLRVLVCFISPHFFNCCLCCGLFKRIL